jgi:hypothetical protein
MTNQHHQSGPTAKEAEELKKKQQDAAQLQYEFAKAWNAYLKDKTKANDVVAKGDELLEVHKSLGGRASGALAPSQIKLRQDYAKESIEKGEATKELTTSEKSLLKHYTNDKGQRVWKIGK